MSKRNLQATYYVCVADRYAHRTYLNRGHLCPKCREPMEYCRDHPPASRDDHKAWKALEQRSGVPGGLRVAHNRRLRQLRNKLRAAKRNQNLAQWERELLRQH